MKAQLMQRSTPDDSACSRRELLGGRFFTQVVRQTMEVASALQCVLTPVVVLPTKHAPRTQSLELPLIAGVAQIHARSCLAHMCSFCTVCSEQCPVQGAITVQRGKPIVHANACTGCGICVTVCPAPTPAIVIVPRTADSQIS